MFGFAIYAIPVAEIIILGLSIVLTVLFARRDRALWQPAIFGCIALVVVFTIAAIVMWVSTGDWGPRP